MLLRPQLPDSGVRDLVIVGDGEFAEIAFEYFTHDSPYNVVGFSVEREYLKKQELFDLPVVAFEEIESHFPTDAHSVFVAVTYTFLNRVRGRLYREAKAKGYRLATYISSHAFLWHNVTIGENSFIFENNVVQYQVRIGNNVVLWSGNHVGHQTQIRDHCFISSHCVISGYCDIGESSFLGVNSTFHDYIVVAKDTVVGAGAVIVRNTEEGLVYRGNPAVGSPPRKTTLLRPRE
jgi:sugar O-acyltransferase (sialic acid O-acetyltransferase NeuD family)